MISLVFKKVDFYRAHLIRRGDCSSVVKSKLLRKLKRQRRTNLSHQAVDESQHGQPGRVVHEAAALLTALLGPVLAGLVEDGADDQRGRNGARGPDGEPLRTRKDTLVLRGVFARALVLTNW